MLRIALVPIVAIMIVGVGLSGYLSLQGLATRAFADNVRASLDPTIRFISAVQEERRLTTLEVTGMVAEAPGLDPQRGKVDRALDEMKAVTSELAESAPDELHDPLRDLTTKSAEIRPLRQQVDAGEADAQQVYEFYSDLLELVGTGIQGIARSATDAEVGFEQMISYDLFRSVEAQSRSHVLVVRGIAQGLDLDEFHELAHQMGSYHEVAETISPRMTPSEQRKYEDMKATDWWKTLVSGDNAVMAQGPGQHSVDFDLARWQEAAGKLSDGLLALYASHSSHAADLGTSSGNRVLATSLGGGLTVLVVTAAALVVALRESRSLIRRLSKLRNDTLDLTEREMPEVIRRVGEGERIDVDADVPWLDHGDDEIGEVADAFNKAQRQAIGATVRETETRDGVRAVFLNIAHRNQVMAHRQLQVLDRAERSQEDPEQLQLLFELDHLATQGRRNAESLIILGGKQPGRQWRKPVTLRDVINGAIAETAQYTRVKVGKVADTSLQGVAVGDMIHLMAELLDNAASFSPPQTDVDVRATVVGRGVVVEVEDQGLGIELERLDEINVMLREPPDFGVMSLSEETRIGLFVVAQLAARHDIRVTLRESVYGGIRVIVLIPNSALASTETEDQPPAPVEPPSAREEPSGGDSDPLATRVVEAVPPPEPPAPPAPAEETVVVAPEPVNTDPPDTDTIKITMNPRLLGRQRENGSAPGSGARPELPRNGQGTANGKPPLPRRRRHQNLAPQLQADTAQADNEQAGEAQAGPEPREQEASTRSPESFRATMTAFQRGTRLARDEDTQGDPRPRWPGEDPT